MSLLSQGEKNLLLSRRPFKGFIFDNVARYETIYEVSLLPSLFDDSSAEIWLLKGLAGLVNKDLVSSECILKNHKMLLKPSDSSGFWSIMKILFGLDLVLSYKNAHYSYVKLKQISSLKMPVCYDLLQGPNQIALVLEKLDGHTFGAQDLTSTTLVQFTHYLAGLHRNEQSGFGIIEEVGVELKTNLFQINEWRGRLKRVLIASLQSTNMIGVDIAELLMAIDSLETQKYGPVMMDLRWDQFVLNNGNLVGVFDLDAYVYAPIELDFAILEYLLNADQASQFQETYFSLTGQNVCLSHEQRKVYRALFFVMNALGENDYQKWMSQPAIFADQEIET